MTMPIENITVQCPNCDRQYKDWYRGSINLDLDDFDEEYLYQCSSAVCPHCQHKVYFHNLIFKDGALTISNI